jgi:polynucleotide 5'-hydroxyl-kinase GRC3/NOL9
VPPDRFLSRIQIPSVWEDLTFSALNGVILVVGATDTGKTTFARYLYHRLEPHHERLAFVDGDMGQATLGPPTTMTLALSSGGKAGFPPDGPRYHIFVGDISPARHMLPTVVGGHRLVRKAREGGATAIVFDTTGLVAASRGGGALKRALVDMLQVQVVVGLQRGSELEHLLVPLRRSKRTRVIDRPVAEAVKRRDVEIRQRHRAEQYRRAFDGARPLEVEWSRFAAIPSPTFTQHRLVALEDRDGYALGLGIVIGQERSRDTIRLYTTLSSLEDVDALHVGDLLVDPNTFRDKRV